VTALGQVLGANGQVGRIAVQVARLLGARRVTGVVHREAPLRLASRLVAAGEGVVDVPPKLSARTRVFTAGQGRKTDPTDAQAVALAATRMRGLHPVTDDAQLAVLRVLADRRRSLGEDHIRMICQLLANLIPGGAKKALSAAKARVLLGRVRPRDRAGQARRRVAAELMRTWSASTSARRPPTGN